MALIEIRFATGGKGVQQGICYVLLLALLQRADVLLQSQTAATSPCICWQGASYASEQAPPLGGLSTPHHRISCQLVKAAVVLLADATFTYSHLPPN